MLGFLGPVLAWTLANVVDTDKPGGANVAVDSPGPGTCLNRTWFVPFASWLFRADEESGASSKVQAVICIQDRHCRSTTYVASTGGHGSWR